MKMIKHIKSKGFVYLRLIGIILFVVLLFRIDLHSVWKHLRMTNASFLILGLLFQVVLLFFKGIRWHMLKSGNYSLPSMLLDFGILLESYAYGVITPGRIGELMKSGYEGTPNGKLYTAFKVFAERGFDLGIFLFVAGFAVLIKKLIPIGPWASGAVILVGLIMIVFSFFLLTKSKLKSRMWARLPNRISGKRPLENQSFSLPILRTFNIFTMSVLGNVATFISCYFLALGVSLNGSFLVISGGVAVAGMLNLLPVTIMGIGTREYSLLYLFQSYDPGIVLAFSFLMFLVLQIGGGLIAMVAGQIFIYIWKKGNRTNETF
jgi:glycosyltransferase 2 family protein